MINQHLQYQNCPFVRGYYPSKFKEEYDKSKNKVKLSYYTPWRHMGGEKV
jgi:hypothetical protein